MKLLLWLREWGCDNASDDFSSSTDAGNEADDDVDNDDDGDCSKFVFLKGFSMVGDLMNGKGVQRDSSPYFQSGL